MIGSRKGVGWYWAPAIVFFIGAASVFLLLWFARLGENQRDNSLAVDALEDLHIHMATFHFRLEELLAGDSVAAPAQAWEQWNQAAHLLDALQSGGLDEHGQTLGPLTQAEYLARAHRITSALSALRETATQRVRVSRTTGRDAVIEKRFHREFQALLEDVSGLEVLLEADRFHSYQRSKRLIRAAGVAWILIVIVATAGLLTSVQRRARSEEHLREAHEVVLAQTEALRRHERHLAETVEKCTAELSQTNEQLRAEIVERRIAHEALRETEAHIRALSSRLLQAQEVERRRIAMELHDELGQALNVMKLQIRVVERSLGEELAAPKEACEKLLDYIDHVIADVRRLSLNLSPTILEDLGLTSALHWLITGFVQNQARQVTSEIEPIDQLFPAPFRIVIYRIVQEALTNIARHAGAGQVTVMIRRHGGEVAFLVEDHGAGFDAERNPRDNQTGMGFGLTTMQERVRMIGGHFELWSQKGQGTRISFTVPLDTGGQ